MRYFILVWVFQTTFIIGEDSPLRNFYNSLNKNRIIKMEIDFSQNQFGNTYSSMGSLIIIKDKKYVYDSFPIKIIVEDSLITTINNETLQLVYSSIDKNHLSILDILSGSFNNIQFLDKKSSHIDHFKIVELGYDGIFQFDENTGLLNIIKLEIDKDQSLMVEVKSFDYIDHYDISDINEKNFEVIDLRD